MLAPNWSNRTLFHCDNLAVLRGMNGETVDLIATDPPFNKGRDFHATPDSLAAGAKFQDRWSWTDDVEGEWIDQIQDDWPAVWDVIRAARVSWGDDMGAFLCFMGVRLIALHRVLKPTGSLYLHCDPTASHYLKALLDAIFGRKNFRNEIIWRRNESGAKGSQHPARNWGSNADYLLFYTKSDQARLAPYVSTVFSDQELRRKFPKVNEQGERYNTKLTAWRQPSMGARPNLYYEFRGIEPPSTSGWRLSRERMEEEHRKGNIVIRDGKLERRSYAKDFRGAAPGNLWVDTELLRGAQSHERLGYLTQKPIALYERIIQASTGEGEWVLDPFAGCAPTLVAAERLGRQWVGIDIWDGASAIVQQRMADARQLLTDIPTIRYVSTPP